MKTTKEEIEIIRQLVEKRVFWKSEAPIVLLIGTDKKSPVLEALESLKEKDLVRAWFFSSTSVSVKMTQRIKHFIGFAWSQYESRSGAERILSAKLNKFIL